MLVLFAVLFGFAYIVSPALMAYAWVRWAKSKRRRSRRTKVSLAALAIASCSFLLGIGTVASSSIRHNTFLYLAPSHGRIYLLGLITAVAATLVAFVGAFQSNPIRLKALTIALGAVVFWFLAGSSS